jgi:cob(I)alamin adenosyltransferase
MMKLAPALSLALIVGTAPAAAIEQNCRFIQAKAEREACYAKQEAELAAKRKPAQPAATTSDFETMQLMRREDAEVYRSMRSICRGC